MRTKKIKPENKEQKKEKASGLDPEVFDGKVNKSALYQVIRMYQANKRQGNASTKTRAVVSGGGRKPWKQKGTGRARAGSIRSPLWRGGGTIFGPHPRDYSYTLSQSIRSEALRASLNAKHNDSELVIVDSVTVEKPKTKEFKKAMSALKINKKALFVFDKIDANLKLASRNLQGVALKRASDVNALDVMSVDTLVLTKPALSAIIERLKGNK